MPRDASGNGADIAECEMRLRCSEGHRWREVWPVPMTLVAFGNRMKAAGKCPSCGSDGFIGWPKETNDAAA